MDLCLKLSPKANNYIATSIPVQSGTVQLLESGLVAVVIIDSSTNKEVLFEKNQTRDVNSFKTDEVYLIVPGDGITGLSATKFLLDSGGSQTTYEIATILSDLFLDCDADRDGKVGQNEEGKANWTWGAKGKGAIALVDNDRDVYGRAGSLDEREPIVKRALTVTALPADVELRLRVAPDAATKFSITRDKDDGGVEKLLGKFPHEEHKDAISVSSPLNVKEETLRFVAHEYPGPYFEGLVVVNLELIWKKSAKQEVTIGHDRIAIRVAPWIMTPNTLSPKKIYTCEMEGHSSNEDFLKGLSVALKKESIPLEVIPPKLNRGDRWIQDEIEIGYTESHRGNLSVVFDSPRDRYLDAYPEIGMLGEDFGHFVVGGGIANSLDSFGNLEVSPPVVANGKSYPLGRIIFGGRESGDFSHSSRQMMAEVRQFLFAQRVQTPIDIYSDWLAVGHVDEIISFVPYKSASKGFKLLIANTVAVKTLLDKLVKEGHGSTLLFEGKRRLDGSTAEISVDTLASDKGFWDGNAVFQGYLDESRKILKQELGLDESDMVDIPVCFQVRRDSSNQLRRTLAFFPDMINHLVADDLSIVPKPYGPKINGKCAFEKAFEDAIPDRRVVFIDDWYSYHELSGEVHCGTNAQREPFKISRWWEVRPEGGIDIKIAE